jgi:NAD-dependent deacetylase
MNTGIPSGLVSALRSVRSTVVLTGAGVSSESGIPTFRDAMEGLWSKFDASELATPEAFARDPATVTRWYDWRRQKCAAAKPNPGHLAIARLQRWMQQQKRPFTLVTQNVDRLHQAAGSSDVIELHGTLWVWRCVKCGTEREERDVPFKEYPLPCRCGGLRRPAVVWFGEPLPTALLEQAYAAAEGCELLLSIGTSALVYPAAELPQVAQRAGAKVAEINSQRTPLTPTADWALLSKAGEILPNLVETAISR